MGETAVGWMDGWRDGMDFRRQKYLVVAHGMAWYDVGPWRRREDEKEGRATRSTRHGLFCAATCVNIRYPPNCGFTASRGSTDSEMAWIRT